MMRRLLLRQKASRQSLNLSTLNPKPLKAGQVSISRICSSMRSFLEWANRGADAVDVSKGGLEVLGEHWGLNPKPYIFTRKP